MKLSVETKHRIEKFKRNKRALWSLYILAFIFLIGVFAPFIANDKPLILKFDGKYYFPIISPVLETDLGGDYVNAANFNDPFVKNLVDEHGFMIMPLIPYHHSTIMQHLPDSAPTPPDLQNILGTDDHGRDLLARLIYGIDLSLKFSLSLTFCSLLIGVIYGAIAGFYGGKTDIMMIRFVEVWSALPLLYIVIIISGLFQQSFFLLLAIMLLFSWIFMVGVVRAEFLKARNMEYVLAARALGITEFRIMLRHVLPNALVATIAYIPFLLSTSLGSLTVLDFLGIGMPPGSPSLGELITEVKENLSAYWMTASVLVVLSSLMMLMIFIAEGLRDAMDVS